MAPVEHIAPSIWTGRADPEDGPHARRMHHCLDAKGRRGVAGFACEAGVLRNKGRPGAALGPAAIRAALAGMAAPANALLFRDFGDVAVAGDDLEAGQEALATLVSDALAQVERLIVLGGGHETAYGDFIGLRRRFPQKRIGIINLDAHLDIRNIGGSGPSSGTPFNQIRTLDPEGFDYLCIGAALESNTQALFDRAAEWGVRIVEDRALLADSEAADREIAAMASRVDLIYLTIDVDVMPHFQAPGVSAPAARGAPFGTIESIIETVLNEASKAGIEVPLADIVEISPPNDIQGMTARTAAALARRLLYS